MAIDTALPRQRTGILMRTGTGVLGILQILGEVTALFMATLRTLPFVVRDRRRVIDQLVRIGTDTLPIGAVLSLFVGMVLVLQAADQLREVSQGVLGPIVGLATTKEFGPVM